MLLAALKEARPLVLTSHLAAIGTASMSQSSCPQPMEECKPSPPAATILTSTKPFNPFDLVVAPTDRAHTPWTVPTLDNSRLSDDEPWQPKESPNQPLIDSFLGWMPPVPFVMPQQPEVHHPQLCKCADYKPKERRIGKTHQTHFLTFLYHLHLHTPKLGVANVPPPTAVVLTSTSSTSHQDGAKSGPFSPSQGVSTSIRQTGINLPPSHLQLSMYHQQSFLRWSFAQSRLDNPRLTFDIREPSPAVHQDN